MSPSDVVLNGSHKNFNQNSECRTSEIRSKMTEFELRPRSSNNISVCFLTDVSIFIFLYPEGKNSDIGLNLRFAPLDVTLCGVRDDGDDPIVDLDDQASSN